MIYPKRKIHLSINVVLLLLKAKVEVKPEPQAKQDGAGTKGRGRHGDGAIHWLLVSHVPDYLCKIQKQSNSQRHSQPKTRPQ